jgi:hypothetical protein
MDSDPDPFFWIQEAQKHLDPDPDLQHCLVVFSLEEEETKIEKLAHFM